MANGLTIIKDRKSIDNIPNVDLDPAGMRLVGLIEGGNATDVQNAMNMLNAVLQPMEVEVERKDGTALPVEVGSAFFMKGGVNTDAPEFDVYKGKFELDRSVGYNVVAYNYDAETILAAKRGEIEIDEQKLKATKKITNVYSKKYLPFNRLKALITGSSETSSIPTLDPGTTTGVDAFDRAFGCARGEDFSDFLTIADGDGIRNFYRTIENANMSTTDVDNLVDSIRDTNDYSFQGVVALANPRTVKNYAKLAAQDTATQDSIIFDDVKTIDIDGVHWVAIDGFHPDFVVFYDMGKMEELLIRGVEAGDPNQRGLGIIYQNKLEAWNTISDIDGAKLRIFPEEWYMPWRLSVGILDTNATRFHASGLMQDGAGKSVEALEAWVSKMEGYFETVE